MNNRDYNKVWTMFGHNPEGDYSTIEIEAIITRQSRQTSKGLRRYLQLDVFIKIASVIVLLWVSFLLEKSGSFTLLLATAGFGGVLIGRQILLIRQFQLQVDFSLSVQEVVRAVVKQVKSNLSLAGFLVAMTNPLLILAGSFMYFYLKYGPTIFRDTEDMIVTLIFMSIGSIIGYFAFNIQQKAEVIDLEESLNALHNETGVTLSLIVLRKQRRKKIILALIVIGVVLFLLLLATYLGRT